MRRSRRQAHRKVNVPRGRYYRDDFVCAARVVLPGRLDVPRGRHCRDDLMCRAGVIAGAA